MVIGTASVILVVTISLTSRDYILEQIQGIGSNIIFAYYVTGGPTSPAADADYIKMADVAAIRNELRADIVAATGVMSNFDQMLIARQAAGRQGDRHGRRLRRGAQYRDQQRAAFSMPATSRSGRRSRC